MSLSLVLSCPLASLLDFLRGLLLESERLLDEDDDDGGANGGGVD